MIYLSDFPTYHIVEPIQRVPRRKPLLGRGARHARDDVFDLLGEVVVCGFLHHQVNIRLVVNPV